MTAKSRKTNIGMAKNTRSRAPEFLADLIDYSKCTLVNHGLSKEDATNVANAISKQMCDQWGGLLIYFPYWLRMELTERDHKIYEEFNGKNHQELSRNHKLSLQAIYRIVNAVRLEEITRRQQTLDL
jgi:Mor family transcriptional regulator